MKRFLLLFVALLCVGLPTFAQSTTVSGQVTDLGGQTWNNGKVTAILQPNPAYPNIGIYTWTGGALSPNITASLNGTGGYSFSIPSNGAISPASSTWKFMFCPQASSPCVTTGNVSVNGGTLTLNQTPPAILINLQTAVPPILGYSTAEITGAGIGSTFYLLGSGLQICSAAVGNNCTVWGGTSGGGSPGLPVNSVQCNVANAFSACPNLSNPPGTVIDTGNLTVQGNTVDGGPNPWYDITLYGGYSSGAPPSAVGTMSSTSSTLTLTSAQDFANKQGVVVYGAGPAPSITAPTAPTVTPAGILNGGTNYTYCVAPEDYNGGVTACSAIGTTASGASALGNTSATLSGSPACSRTSGVVTCTTSAAHNFQSGSQVFLTSVPAQYNGAFTITATPSGTSFQFNQYGLPDESGLVTSGTAQVRAVNILRWTQNNPYTAIRSHVYRCIGSPCALPANAASFSFLGVVEGMDGYFVDYNYTANRAHMTYVPATAPTAAVNEWLRGTITSGGGTTTLILSAASTNAVAGATVLHDDAVVIDTVLCPLMGQGGGTIYFPQFQQFIFNTNTFFTGCTGQTKWEIAGGITTHESIVTASSVNFEGQPNNFNTAPFYGPWTAAIGGNGYPLVYTKPNVAAANKYTDMVLVCDQPYQSCFVADSDTGGQGPVGLFFRDTHMSSNGPSPVFIARGGFGYFWKNGGIESIPSSFSDQPAMTFTENCSTGSVNTVSYLMTFEQPYIFGGVTFDACGVAPTTPWRQIKFEDTLAESSYGPMFRFIGFGNNDLTNLKIIRPTYADLLGGVATPMFDFTGINLGTGGSVEIDNALPATGNQPILETNATNTPIYCIGACTGANNYGYWEAATGVNIMSNVSLETIGTGVLGAQIARPVAPVISLTAGGTLPVDTYCYSEIPVDVNGLPGPTSPESNCVTTNGSQQITITWTAVNGQTAATLCRSNAGAVPNFCSAVAYPTGALNIPGNSYVDNRPQSDFANSQFTVSGTSSSVGSMGLATYLLTLSANGFSDSISATGLTASRTVNFPDQSGTVVLSASPTFTGTPAAPTAAVGTNTTQLATTAFVMGETNVFFMKFLIPVTITSTFTGETMPGVTRAINVDSMTAYLATAPVGCSTFPVGEILDTTASVVIGSFTFAASTNQYTVTVSHAAVPAGDALAIRINTAAVGCSTNAANLIFNVQYH